MNNLCEDFFLNLIYNVLICVADISFILIWCSLNFILFSSVVVYQPHHLISIIFPQRKLYHENVFKVLRLPFYSPLRGSKKVSCLFWYFMDLISNSIFEIFTFLTRLELLRLATSLLTEIKRNQEKYKTFFITIHVMLTSEKFTSHTFLFSLRLSFTTSYHHFNGIPATLSLKQPSSLIEISFLFYSTLFFISHELLRTRVT